MGKNKLLCKYVYEILKKAKRKEENKKEEKMLKRQENGKIFKFSVFLYFEKGKNS